MALIRKHSQVYSTVVIFFNSVAVALAWLFAYLTRFELELFSPAIKTPGEIMYLYSLLPIWLVFYASSRILGHSQLLKRHTPTSEYFSILQLTSLSVLILTAGTFFYRDFSYSRIMTVYFWIFCNMFLLFSHQLVRLFIKEAHSRGLGLRKVLVIGSGELGQRVVQRLNMYPEIGFTVVGYLTRNPESVGSDIEGGKVLGLYEDLNRNYKRT